MTTWPSRDWRTRVSVVVTSPQRWSLNDRIVAIAAAALAVSVFLPWYKAVVRLRNSALSGFLIQPKGTATGIGVHEYLWAVFGLALLQFVVLVTRYPPGRNPRTIPMYGLFLVITSAISFALALIAFVLKPSTWHGGNVLGGGLYVVVSQDYGAIAAVIAALASVLVAWTVLRDPAAR